MPFNTVGIIGAMKEEVELLHRHVRVSGVRSKAGIDYATGELHGKRVIFCRSGVGKVNAAVCTQILIDQGADCVVFTGVAGALDPTLDIGDIVISTVCQQHDVDVSALGFPRGVIPFQERSEFEADERLVRLAVFAGEALYPGRCRTGKLLSGDQFIASRQIVRELRETFGGVCVEMEGAAVAQVCAMNGVPFVIIRSMSDRADGGAPESFEAFTVEAANRSYRLVEAMLMRMEDGK
ncbi:MAG: 5'-methylthioadenosine/S-adenosylhomocysteine nucleosidase [Thermobacillus sp. ZCTH02-B1]|uniref:5'-methylthioadenosine/adenosylhomocysteine nucleosidase n=1 Tax=Thermobacillus sp. ZCTH02-B1 TaxID=1858795 RepID=UPI000B55806D|nr:5'-methylthioadenosine/adenosylhomocysteine nucleosidase [Thermobacillus sp. ZCTH02-B1]OUM96469.1 MAG: 5'-methylthioadenosine/S-adenosylhomocysteine nucleosidase [Thermobacillus sp. ZCTH02-B1]